MIAGYFGNYTVRIDSKGRLALPAKLRPVSDPDSPRKDFIMTKGLDDCVALYPEEEWSKIVEKFESLDFTQKDFRNYSRQLYASAVTVTPDRQGRMMVSTTLKNGAELDSEVLVIGAGNHIELWNPELYDKYLNQFGQSYEEVAENLFPKNRPPKSE